MLWTWTSPSRCHRVDGAAGDQGPRGVDAGGGYQSPGPAGSGGGGDRQPLMVDMVVMHTPTDTVVVNTTIMEMLVVMDLAWAKCHRRGRGAGKLWHSGIIRVVI